MSQKGLRVEFQLPSRRKAKEAPPAPVKNPVPRIARLLASVRAGFRLRGRPVAHRWFYLVSPPAIALLFGFNFVASLLDRSIEWGGVRYTMLSPSRTRVLRP